MIMYHLGPQLGVWIMQVPTFSSVMINRFHYIYILLTTTIMEIDNKYHYLVHIEFGDGIQLSEMSVNENG